MLVELGPDDTAIKNKTKLIHIFIGYPIYPDNISINHYTQKIQNLTGKMFGTGKGAIQADLGKSCLRNTLTCMDLLGLANCRARWEGELQRQREGGLRHQRRANLNLNQTLIK